MNPTKYSKGSLTRGQILLYDKQKQARYEVCRGRDLNPRPPDILAGAPLRTFELSL